MLSTSRLCDICCVYVSKAGFEGHIVGRQHQATLDRKLSGTLPPALSPRVVHCRACNHYHHPNGHERHISTTQHTHRQRWLDEALRHADNQNLTMSPGSEEDIANDAPAEDTSQSEPSVDIRPILPDEIGLSISYAEGIDFGVLEEPNDGQEWSSVITTKAITLDKSARDTRISFVRARIYSGAEDPSPQ